MKSTAARRPRSNAPRSKAAPAARNTLAIRNRQRTVGVALPALRRLLRDLLREQLPHRRHELCFHLVEADEMACVNETFLQHEGPTDVITFDHSTGDPAAPLQGEVFICLSEAVAQARRFRVEWPEELVRYAVHGVLHLCGHDDRQPQARRAMKRAENRLVAALAGRFPLSQLRRSSRMRP